MQLFKLRPPLKRGTPKQKIIPPSFFFLLLIFFYNHEKTTLLPFNIYTHISFYIIYITTLAETAYSQQCQIYSARKRQQSPS
jgi:hypothetical protein